MRSKLSFLAFLLIAGGVSLAVVDAKSREEQPQKERGGQIVVRVHKSSKGLEYEMRSYNLKKGEANYWLAEIKLRECKDCQIIPILDDDVELAAITQISEMAVNAGFKDIRPFVYWRKTARMAQIEFGPLIKATDDPEKIAQREAKEARAQHFAEIK